MTFTDEDLDFSKMELSWQVGKMKEIYFEARPEICTERARLITEYSRNHNLFGKKRVTILEKARMYRYVLERREAMVYHDHYYKIEKDNLFGIPTDNWKKETIEPINPFAGSTTSKFKGVPLYPEFLGLAIWPELSTIENRADNPYYLSKNDEDILNSRVFPYWMNDTILELARARYKNDPKIQKALNLKHHLVFFLATKAECISHCIPDFSRAIDVGLRAMIDEAREKEGRAGEAGQKEFFAAVVEVLEGLITYAHNLADKAKFLAQREKDAKKKQVLEDMARIYRQVPEHPAQTFQEGLTTVWLCWTALHLENPNIGLSLGRLDQLPLMDLYTKDLRAKRLTKEKAVELICYLWLKIGDHVPMIPDAAEQLFGGTGSNQAITIGGVRARAGDPEDAVNPLTYLILKSTELMKLRDPNLNARYYLNVNSDKYLNALANTIKETRATPALHNDLAVIKALTGVGDTLEQARDYGIVGCVEPVSNARTYSANASILLNLPSVLELTLFNGRHRHTGLDELISIETGDVKNFTTFAQFQEAFKQQLEWMADLAVYLNNHLGLIHQDYYPTPILSSFFKGPMVKGKDLIQGGAEINASGVTIIGLADTADSLSAIEQVVFNNQQAGWSQLLTAMDRNFGDEDKVLHQRLENAPKYGNEEKLAEDNIHWLLERLHKAFTTKDTYRGDGKYGKYRVGFWTMTNHAGFGRLLKATPNGRRERENLSSGITPLSGKAPELARVLNSAASLPANYITSGMALNLKYTPEPGNDQAWLNNFTATTKGYFDKQQGKRDGGMEIQFNITDRQTFLNAMNHPDDYRDLLVRVSGYTAYFTDLTQRMQKEIVDRNEYSLSKGNVVNYNTTIPYDDRQTSCNFDWLRDINLLPPFLPSFLNPLTDSLLTILLTVMKYTITIMPLAFRESLDGFSGRYVFRTKNSGGVEASIVFNGIKSKVFDKAIDPWNARITFSDEVALLEYLFSKDQDILNVLLENKVQIEGNLNYVYRFGYLARKVREFLSI